MFISYNIYHLTDDTDDGHAKYLSKISFASLCHHHEYLAENLHPQILLRSSTLFLNFPDLIRGCVKIAYLWDKTREAPKCTDVSPHVLLMSEMIDLNIQLKNLQESIGGIFYNVLGGREIGSPELFTKKIMDQLHHMQIEFSTRLKNVSCSQNNCRRGIKLCDAFRS